MDFKSFFSPLSTEARDEFSARCHTTRGHLQNVMYGKTCAPELAVAVERESLGVVRVESMCPRTKWLRVKDKSWPHSDGRPLIDPAGAQQSQQESPPAAPGAHVAHGAARVKHLPPRREGPSRAPGRHGPS